ncbi:hypothetical protein HYN69_04670 [Gemmobacter aquarius]|uniref:Uncharacterized protein n=1 Tax=Paragemmobacter aquarius TaxID=2169400 RepID=A0A2S0UJ93_9RHOB|nr:DUF6641 family protein [Gemmobacter aquarius]AWB47898.1 hypothetical protein HYN69_04670 [Gemmobacter aquarius]
MGVLDKIKLVEMSRKIKPNATQQRRAKLVEQLQEQLKMAEALLNGTTHERTKSTWAKDAEGNRVRVQKPVRVRAWWEVAGNAVQFGLRYGAVPLQLQPGKSAVEVAKLAELPAVIKLLIAAAEAGEMDAAIAGMMAKRGPKEKAVAAQ